MRSDKFHITSLSDPIEGHDQPETVAGDLKPYPFAVQRLGGPDYLDDIKRTLKRPGLDQVLQMYEAGPRRGAWPRSPAASDA